MLPYIPSDKICMFFRLQAFDSHASPPPPFRVSTFQGDMYKLQMQPATKSVSNCISNVSI